MKLQIQPLLLILSFSLICVACGGGSNSEISEQEFSGVWEGLLAQTQSDPEGCDSRLTLEEMHTIEVFPEDSNGDTITIFDSQTVAGPLLGSETSVNSFDVLTASANTLGISETHFIYENVANGRADVTLTFMGAGRNSSCSVTWSGEMVRTESF